MEKEEQMKELYDTPGTQPKKAEISMEFCCAFNYHIILNKQMKCIDRRKALEPCKQCSRGYKKQDS